MDLREHIVELYQEAKETEEGLNKRFHDARQWHDSNDVLDRLATEQSVHSYYMHKLALALKQVEGTPQQ